MVSTRSYSHNPPFTLEKNVSSVLKKNKRNAFHAVRVSSAAFRSPPARFFYISWACFSLQYRQIHPGSKFALLNCNWAVGVKLVGRLGFTCVEADFMWCANSHSCCNCHWHCTSDVPMQGVRFDTDTLVYILSIRVWEEERQDFSPLLLSLRWSLFVPDQRQVQTFVQITSESPAQGQRGKRGSLYRNTLSYI